MNDKILARQSCVNSAVVQVNGIKNKLFNLVAQTNDNYNWVLPIKLLNSNSRLFTQTSYIGCNSVRKYKGCQVNVRSEIKNN